MAAIEPERLKVAPLGILYTSRVVMQLPQMPNRVCKQERVAFGATDGNAFLVQLQRLIVAPGGLASTSR